MNSGHSVLCAKFSTKREQERLDVVHHLMVRTLGGRFFTAPIEEDKIQNILDIGTGTGSRTCIRRASKRYHS